jgi:hypothetical protein
MVIAAFDEMTHNITLVTYSLFPTRAPIIVKYTMSEKEKNQVNNDPAGFTDELPFLDQSYFPSAEEIRAILSLPA